MNICIIHSAEERSPFSRRGFYSALLSYKANGNSLLAENIPSDTYGDIMIISADNIGEHITPAIYDECRRREYHAVFLDADEKNYGISQALSSVSESLTRRGVSVFCPLSFSDICPKAIPVAEAAASGGVLSEYISHLTKKHKRLALAIPLTCAAFSMPVTSSCAGQTLSQRELRRIKDTYSAKPFFSPQMLVNYFIYSPAHSECRFVLFDDARTVSEKIRLAKRAGVSDIFLTYREIADIADDISF